MILSNKERKMLPLLKVQNARERARALLFNVREPRIKAIVVRIMCAQEKSGHFGRTKRRGAHGAKMSYKAAKATRIRSGVESLIR